MSAPLPRSAYPRTMFQPRSFPRVQTVIVARESGTNWWIQSGDREQKLFKKGYDGALFDTFEAAKAFGVERERRIVHRVRIKLDDAIADLAKWETMTKAAPPEQPISLPKDIDISALL